MISFVYFVIRFNSQKKFLIWNIDFLVEETLILNEESLINNIQSKLF